MSLLKMIKDEQLHARKTKDTVKASVLTTLIGEAVSVGKNDGNRDTTDSEIVAVIKKFIKNIDETLKVNDITRLRDERTVLDALLPTQLTTEEVTQLVAELVIETGASTPKDMGKVMKVLKERYDGQYDGGIASKLIREKLGA